MTKEPFPSPVAGIARKPHWRQPTPQLQLIALLGAARGLSSNIEEGLYHDRETLASKARDLDFLLEEALQLSPLIQGNWQNASSSNL